MRASFASQVLLTLVIIVCGAAAQPPRLEPPKPLPRDFSPSDLEFYRRQMAREQGKFIRGMLEHGIAQGEKTVAILEGLGGEYLQLAEEFRKDNEKWRQRLKRLKVEIPEAWDDESALPTAPAPRPVAPKK